MTYSDITPHGLECEVHACKQTHRRDDTKFKLGGQMWSETVFNMILIKTLYQVELTICLKEFIM